MKDDTFFHIALPFIFTQQMFTLNISILFAKLIQKPKHRIYTFKIVHDMPINPVIFKIIS